MEQKAAELALEVPAMWRRDNIIYMRVPTPTGDRIRAYPIDVAIKTHAGFGVLIKEFYAEQAEVVPLPETGSWH